MSHNIIDRRLNPGGKNIGNRQRFIRRAKEQLKKSVKEGLSDRSITSDGDQNVSIPTKGISEPWIHHNPSTGKKDHVLPGNHDFIPGDIIEKPPKGGGGSGNDASDDGEGEDDFNFAISKDEFNDILFEDLELPDLQKRGIKETVAYTTTRAGFVTDGTPNNLDLYQSMRKSLGRRIALKKPKQRRIREINEELIELNSKSTLTEEDKALIIALEDELIVLKRRATAVSYIDPIDLKYRNYEKTPIPKHKAVMFCVMDVSASMGVEEKDLAKRFYLLLYLFLQYKYDTVDVVYIRHHSKAIECTEEEFFYSQETGGTIVSTGFEEMLKIVKARYSVDEWNLYVAQASDGDNFETDNAKLTEIITKEILPISQYFAYIEVCGLSSNRATWYKGKESEYGLWPVYRKIQETHKNVEMKKVQDPKHVYSVFRELFEKDKSNA